MPYVMQKERAAMISWLVAQKLPPMDEKFWVHESHYSEFANREKFPTCAGSSLEVGERLEIDWMEIGPMKGTVRGMGSAGFSLELDKPFTGGIPPHEIGWIFPSYGSAWQRIK